MNKLFAAAYAVVCYAIFLVAFLYAIGFVGNFVVPRSIDVSPTSLSTAAAIVLDAVLLGIFAVQHSVMARRGFKQWWTRLVPRHLERSTYVLIASVILLAMFWYWAPMTAIVWNVSTPALRGVLWAVFALGWLTVLTSTFMIDHFDLFGLKQVYLYLNGKGPRPPEFRTHFLYGLVRHPIMVGFIIAFWAAPTMTAGHLLFAVATTGYIIIGTRLEERDLVAAIGQPYVDYQQKVPALVPLPRSKS
jgi:protein-S-isoprenylcysteine O-methyltransferase Ste14